MTYTMPANYDHIARFYDLLSRLVFGNSIIKAQGCLLKYIPAGSSILIVGGGTGWILEKIAEQYPQGLEIDYIEASSQMISLSQQRDCKQNKVNFIHLPIENYDADKRHDVIFTPFIFDNLKAAKIDIVFAKLDQMMKENGTWLYADFVYDKGKSPLWQGLLLTIMYLFFRLTTGIESQELVSMRHYFSLGYKVQIEIPHYFGFIRSIVYRRLLSS